MFFIANYPVDDSLPRVFCTHDTNSHGIKGGIAMSYKNGKQILPRKLLLELQKYVQGELVYIPKPGECRAGWGENNGTRIQLMSRNIEIYNLYRSGISVKELIETYHLSEDSIRKIITKTNKELAKSIG